MWDTYIVPQACQDVPHVYYETCKDKTPLRMRMDGLVDGGDTYIVPQACQDMPHVYYETKRHCACVWTVGRWWDTYIVPQVCFLFVISEKTVVGLSDIPRMIETHSYYIFNSLYKLTIVLHDWISACQR